MNRRTATADPHGNLHSVSLDEALFSDNERTAPSQSSRHEIAVGPLDLGQRGNLDGVTVAYETWGSYRGDNAVLICHALSGDSHATGWWDRVVGPGKPIDTDRYFVICSNCLGGCQGTTGPNTLASDGEPFGTRFPIVLISDMVEVQGRLLDHLGVDELALVAGGSMGGQQALQWSVQFPTRVRNVWCTASGPAHSALQIGFNEVARQAIMRDPKWQGGRYLPDDPPTDGLSVARMIGHLTFLSELALETKFGRRLQEKESFEYTLGTEFQIESYLNYQGNKFTRRFDPNSLLYLMKAIDIFERRDLAGARARFLFTSFTSDWLYPPHQSEAAHQLAQAAGCDSRHEIIDLPYGHDAFLLDAEHQGAALVRFMNPS